MGGGAHVVDEVSEIVEPFSAGFWLRVGVVIAILYLPALRCVRHEREVVHYVGGAQSNSFVGFLQIVLVMNAQLKIGNIPLEICHRWSTPTSATLRVALVMGEAASISQISCAGLSLIVGQGKFSSPYLLPCHATGL
jgi:hypothetical protein